MITLGSYSTRIRSECAAAIPAMASLTSVSGVLISFLSLVVTAASAIATSYSSLLLPCRQNASEHEHPDSLPHQKPQTDRRQVDAQPRRIEGPRHQCEQYGTQRQAAAADQQDAIQPLEPRAVN